MNPTNERRSTSIAMTTPVVLAVGLLALFVASGQAQTLSKATTARAARQEAIQLVPFAELTRGTQDKLAAVLNRSTVYRRLPIENIECDPDLYVFLVRHPEVIINIWKMMGITQVDANRVGPFTLTASDGVGTVSQVELVYGTPDLHIMYAEGSYEGPLLRQKVHGRCVMILKSEYVHGKNGRVKVKNQLDVFVRIDHVAANIVAKTLHPLFGKTADHNFVETARFVGKISKTAESNGPGIRQLAGRLSDLKPEVRDRFAEVGSSVDQRTYLRYQQVMGQVQQQPKVAPAGLQTTPRRPRRQGTGR